MPEPPTQAHQNRLAAEPSPYLRQHAHNPVDWWPWGEEAFAEARRRDVPVLLSIGYATCHWCHVMAHECFEDAEVARRMNEAFVNIKVDREERPDVDGVYMQVCQMMTGSGGWPLTVLLTPDKKPFFAGTYFPKESRHGRIGMLDLVPRVQEAWRTRRAELEAQAEHVLQHVRGEEHDHDGETVGGELAGPASGEGPGLAEMRHAVAALAQRFDREHAGFGGAPRFPMPQTLLFLLRMHHRDRDGASLRMVDAQLDAMARGGIRDHLGGGFHRYSTDREWLLPHFEKMLYDQALLAVAYLEHAHVTRNPAYADVARSTLDYVLRDLQDEAGGFHCGEDADSEGEEGRFYVWTRSEVLGVLGPQEGAVFCRAYGITEDGNYRDEATRERTGANILHLPRSVGELARVEGVPAEALAARLQTARARLLEARARRVRPGLDDKVLTDWNGLLLAALSTGARVLGEPRYRDAAVRLGTFLSTTMMDAKGRLRHRYHHGRTDTHSFLDDHAYLLWGYLELHQATQDPLWLGHAVQVAGQLEARFLAEGGGFWQSPHDGEQLPARRKEAYDGALPSGNGVAAWQLARLGLLTADPRWTQLAQDTVSAFAARIVEHPHAFPALLCALDLLVGPTKEFAVTSGPGHERLLEAARRSYQPRLVVLKVTQAVHAVAPWTKEHVDVGGRAAAYLCENFTCRQPLTDDEALLRALEGPSGTT